MWPMLLPLNLFIIRSHMVLADVKWYKIYVFVMQWMFVCSACQSEMANTIARVLTSLLSADEERPVQEQQQQQHVRLAYGDYCTAYTWVCLRQVQCTLTVSCLSSYRMANDKWLLPSVLWRCWLGDRKGIRPVKKLEWWGCWRGYLSGVWCRLAYGPADATATYCLLLQ